MRVIPSVQALKDFNLDRYVRSKTYNGSKENPFIKVGNDPGTPTGQYDSDEKYYMNEIVMEVFEYQPVKMKTEEINGVVRAILDYGGGSAANRPTIVDNFRILLTGDIVTIEHRHTWESGQAGTFNGLYNAIDNLTSDIGMYASMAVNVAASVNASDGSYSTPATTRVDYQKVYKNTEYPTLNITFDAFTNNNFIDDIYLPLLALTAYTYPKRFTGTTDDPSFLNAAADTVAGAASAAGQKVKESLSLTARQYSLKPPCLFNIYHQSGLYSYSNCMCNSMSVQYDGPWYNTTADEQQFFDMVNTGPVKMNVSRRSFPSQAHVTMSFETGEIMTRGDFKTMETNFLSLVDSNSGSTTFTQYGKTTKSSK